VVADYLSAHCFCTAQHLRADSSAVFTHQQVNRQAHPPGIADKTPGPEHAYTLMSWRVQTQYEASSTLGKRLPQRLRFRILGGRAAHHHHLHPHMAPLETFYAAFHHANSPVINLLAHPALGDRKGLIGQVDVCDSSTSKLYGMFDAT
jgi:hypothetical protein